jgi:hypothetical protein
MAQPFIFVTGLFLMLIIFTEICYYMQKMCHVVKIKQ